MESEDGLFWMSFEDFKAIFTEVCVSRCAMSTRRASHEKRHLKAPKSLHDELAPGTRRKLGGRAAATFIEVFNLLDTNRSGVLEKHEQNKAKKELHSMLLPQARFEWSDIDENMDGKVTLAEWLNAMAAIVIVLEENGNSKQDLLDAVARWKLRYEERR